MSEGTSLSHGNELKTKNKTRQNNGRSRNNGRHRPSKYKVSAIAEKKTNKKTAKPRDINSDYKVLEIFKLIRKFKPITINGIPVTTIVKQEEKRENEKEQEQEEQNKVINPEQSGNVKKQIRSKPKVRYRTKHLSVI